MYIYTIVGRPVCYITMYEYIWIYIYIYINVYTYKFTYKYHCWDNCVLCDKWFVQPFHYIQKLILLIIFLKLCNKKIECVFFYRLYIHIHIYIYIYVYKYISLYILILYLCVYRKTLTIHVHIFSKKNVGVHTLRYI